MAVTSGATPREAAQEAQERDRLASVVVIGAGIVGNSVAYHLAERGWSSIVMVDKGPLPDTGAATGQASSLIVPADHSKRITEIRLDCRHQYEELGVPTASAGTEAARTE